MWFRRVLTLISETGDPAIPTAIIDPNETVTLLFAFRDAGGTNVTNLIATLARHQRRHLAECFKRPADAGLWPFDLWRPLGFTAVHLHRPGHQRPANCRHLPAHQQRPSQRHEQPRHGRLWLHSGHLDHRRFEHRVDHHQRRHHRLALPIHHQHQRFGRFAGQGHHHPHQSLAHSP